MSVADVLFVYILFFSLIFSKKNPPRTRARVHDAIVFVVITGIAIYSSDDYVEPPPSRLEEPVVRACTTRRLRIVSLRRMLQDDNISWSVLIPFLTPYNAWIRIFFPPVNKNIQNTWYRYFFFVNKSYVLPLFIHWIIFWPLCIS